MDAKTKEETLKTIRLIYDAFGFDDVEAEEDSALFPRLADGSLVFDEANDRLEYRLKKPIVLKNEEKLEVVTFREPSAGELEYIRKGVSIGSESNVFGLGDLVTMTLKTLIKTGDIATGVADRIMGRDLAELTPIMVELGFFYR